MEDFKKFLSKTNTIPAKKIPYYLNWVTKFFSFTHLAEDSPLPQEKITAFRENMGKNYEEWQVKQAIEALRLFIFFQTQRQSVSPSTALKNKDWDGVIGETIQVLCLKHRALSTERSYLHWIKSFIFFLKGKSPAETKEKPKASGCFVQTGNSENFQSYGWHLSLDGQAHIWLRAPPPGVLESAGEGYRF